MSTNIIAKALSAKNESATTVPISASDLDIGHFLSDKRELTNSNTAGIIA
jgi:hypothetical protein